MSPSKANPSLKASAASAAQTPANGFRAALDFDSRGIRAAAAFGKTIVTLSLRDMGLSPASLVSVRQSEDPGSLPNFPTLLEILGTDRPLILKDLQAERPDIHLRNLLGRATAGLTGWSGNPLQDLAILVPTFATDLQRSLTLKSAQAKGWQSVQLANRTTCAAAQALQDRRPGNYLVLVLGHGPAEASLVRWRSKKLRVLNHSHSRTLSGEEMDRLLIGSVMQAMQRKARRSIDWSLYSDVDWLWLRQQAESARSRLDVFRDVTLEIPESLSEGTAREVVLTREGWKRRLGQLLKETPKLIEGTCREAGVEAEQLEGLIVVISDSVKACLLPGILPYLPAGRWIQYQPDIFLIGACQILLDQPVQSKAGDSVDREQASGDLLDQSRLAFPGARKGVQPQGLQEGADAIIARVQGLSEKGCKKEAAAELGPLKKYVQVLELSLKDPAEALSALSDLPKTKQPGDASEAERKAAAKGSRSVSKTGAMAPDSDSKVQVGRASQKTKRRKYLLAKEDLKNAQAALQAGQLEAAVRLGHVASDRSEDPRIFKAMIKVHLLAAAKRPPQPANFPDEKRWCLCALNDDGTSEAVQQAVTQRFLVHAQQLSEMGTREAHAQAIATLKELGQHVPMVEHTQIWLRKLKEGLPGKVRLDFIADDKEKSGS